MPRDEAVFGSLIVAFAALCVAHLSLVLGLARQPPRWRALVALVIVPLAPFWGRRERMHTRVVAWVVSACAYACLLWLASR
jgi:hypothetical protein